MSQPTFIECDLHDDAVLGTRTGGAPVALGLLPPGGDGGPPAGVGVGRVGAAQQGGGQAGAAQPGPDGQRHHAFLQLLWDQQEAAVSRMLSRMNHA